VIASANEYDAFLIGFPYDFGAAPIAPTPVSPRSYLVFFDWDKATMTDSTQEIAAPNYQLQHTAHEVCPSSITAGATATLMVVPGQALAPAVVLGSVLFAGSKLPDVGVVALNAGTVAMTTTDADGTLSSTGLTATYALDPTAPSSEMFQTGDSANFTAGFAVPQALINLAMNWSHAMLSLGGGSLVVTGDPSFLALGECHRTINLSSYENIVTWGNGVETIIIARLQEKLQAGNGTGTVTPSGSLTDNITVTGVARNAVIGLRNDNGTNGTVSITDSLNSITISSWSDVINAGTTGGVVDTPAGNAVTFDGGRYTFHPAVALSLCSYLVFFDWDKETVTDGTQEISAYGYRVQRTAPLGEELQSYSDSTGLTDALTVIARQTLVLDSETLVLAPVTITNSMLFCEPVAQAGTNVIPTTTADANGTFSFAGLTTSTYALDPTAPSSEMFQTGDPDNVATGFAVLQSLFNLIDYDNIVTCVNGIETITFVGLQETLQAGNVTGTVALASTPSNLGARLVVAPEPSPSMADFGRSLAAWVPQSQML
jgi:hypothetical protein